MTRLFNRPEDFADEMIEGFVAANRSYVRAVPGGVVRATRPPEPQVAVVIGGGSGHYPAFGGLVGPGLAHGAAMGNLFASPSSGQVRSVATAAECGGGVLLTYGNYAGDVLNFDAAQEELRAAGVPCETVTVTDDVSSSPVAEKHRRRGIAGDLTVFRAAGAAAAAGHDLAEVARIARHANERTRSFGVAFTGCTLPGAGAPLFTVPEGRMAVGLGIHGEPGIGETDVPTADGLADLLVRTLLAELPDGVENAEGARVVPILNGLGAMKYEEMFVVYRSVARLLDTARLEVVDPHVGEYCTSFDMAGTSLTLFWLDDELERLWSTSVDAPAYRRGTLARNGEPTSERSGRPSLRGHPRSKREGERDQQARIERHDTADTVQSPGEVVTEGSAASREAAHTVLAALAALARAVDEHVEELGSLDAIAGDGDHGIGMQRGARAALEAAGAAAEAGAGAGTTLALAAEAWSYRAGGTSGALWGVALRCFGEVLGDIDAPSPEMVASGVRRAADGVVSHGKAQPGDKTLVDALLPFADTLDREIGGGAPLADAWCAAASAATAAAAATADLLPRVGRARPHAERSLGTPDPGAHSFALIASAVGEILGEPLTHGRNGAHG